MAQQITPARRALAATVEAAFDGTTPRRLAQEIEALDACEDDILSLAEVLITQMETFTVPERLQIDKAVRAGKAIWSEVVVSFQNWQAPQKPSAPAKQKRTRLLSREEREKVGLGKDAFILESLKEHFWRRPFNAEDVAKILRRANYTHVTERKLQYAFRSGGMHDEKAIAAWFIKVLGQEVMKGEVLLQYDTEDRYEIYPCRKLGRKVK